MKRQYKIIKSIIFAEILIILVLKLNNIVVQSWIGKVVGLFVFLLPIQILLFFLYKNENQSQGKRVFYRILFWFIIICYLLGGVTTLLQQ